jgi:hypothetical protein
MCCMRGFHAWSTSSRLTMMRSRSANPCTRKTQWLLEPESKNVFLLPEVVEFVEVDAPTTETCAQASVINGPLRSAYNRYTTHIITVAMR